MNDLKSAEYSPVPALVGNAVGVGVPLRGRVPQLAATSGKRVLLAGRSECRVGDLERIQRQMRARSQGAGLQMPLGCGQAQRLAGVAGQPLGFFQQAAADAAFAGDFAHAQVRQAPGFVAALQQGGAEQTVIEATGDQTAIGQSAAAISASALA